MAQFLVGGARPKFVTVNGTRAKYVTINGTRVWADEITGTLSASGAAGYGTSETYQRYENWFTIPAGYTSLQLTAAWISQIYGQVEASVEVVGKATYYGSWSYTGSGFTGNEPNINTSTVFTGSGLQIHVVVNGWINANVSGAGSESVTVNFKYW